MRKIFLLLILSLNLFASYSFNIIPGWTLLRSPYNNVEAKKLTINADIIYTYKNNTWYGFSPNGLYTKELESKKIKSFSTLNAGEAFWIFTTLNTQVSFTGAEVLEKKISLKEGWNFVGITGESKIIVPSFYFTSENEIESLWTYNTYTNKWNAYSSNENIKEDIKNDEYIDFIENLDSSKGLWVKAGKDLDIDIVDFAPFFVEDKSTYTINEKNMDNFSLKAMDPNGDVLSYTIDGEDKDSFFVNKGLVQFKKINTIPKIQYNVNISVNDGKTSISKNIKININRRYENDYDTTQDSIGEDPLAFEQWYLDEAHLNINEVHKKYSGKSKDAAIIQVVETGFNIYHPDLIANMDFSMTYDASVFVNDLDEGVEGPYSDGYEYHATAVAGIIGARGNNAIGVKGINPFGKLVSFKFGRDSLGLQVNRLDIAWRDGPRANEIDVSSNSWGDCTNYNTSREKILKDGSENLRDGKGRIYVFPAGNHRIGYNNCFKNSANLQNMINNPYAITVASMGRDDKVSENSNPGSNLFISAYGKDSIWTSTLNSYAGGFGGTSAAVPMVSAGIGLLLEACPSLSYRDVKNIIAKSAVQVDKLNPTWIKNAANIYHSRDYGFGKLNIMGAITMCQDNYTPIAEVKSISEIKDINENISNYGELFNININISEDLSIEWLGIYLDGKLDKIGEYEFTLTSPFGTKVQLIHGDNASRDYNLNTSDFILENSSADVYRLASQSFLDESTSGVWTLGISDKNTTSIQANKLLRKVKLEIIGH